MLYEELREMDKDTIINKTINYLKKEKNTLQELTFYLEYVLYVVPYLEKFDDYEKEKQEKKITDEEIENGGGYELYKKWEDQFGYPQLKQKEEALE